MSRYVRRSPLQAADYITRVRVIAPRYEAIGHHRILLRIERPHTARRGGPLGGGREGGKKSSSYLIPTSSDELSGVVLEVRGEGSLSPSSLSK